MIDRSHDLPLGRQAELLGLNRSTLYYEPRPVPAAELAIMRRIDELHLDFPFAGSRMLRDLLRGEGVVIGRELVATLMRRMGIEAIYRKPNTSKAALGHKIYPYLLRGLAIERPNQVWATDITYIPMSRGFVYLAAVVDWFSRRVLSWRLSITMDVDFWDREQPLVPLDVLRHRPIRHQVFRGIGADVVETGLRPAPDRESGDQRQQDDVAGNAPGRAGHPAHQQGRDEW